MLLGSGSNGKSVFISLLKQAFGKQATSNESLHSLETDKYRAANLYGKRLNAFPDLKDEPLQTNEKFNIIVGNDQELSGEFKYKTSFDFKPTIKMLFSANKPPFAYTDNYAYYRRWTLIQFTHTFTDDADEALIDKLTTESEKSGLLNLMLSGLKTICKNRKYSYSGTVAEVERIYKLQSDNVASFVTECVHEVVADEEETIKDVVFRLYLEWCKSEKLIPNNLSQFSRRMNKLGRGASETTWNSYDGRKIKRRYYRDTVVTSESIKPKETIQSELPKKQ